MEREMNGNPGMQSLARVIADRARYEGSQAPRELVLDVGVIQDDMSLMANTYPIKIQKKDYHVCRQLTLGATGSELLDTTTVSGHAHKGLVPEKMRTIKPGDRVLIGWIGDVNAKDVVIIDIITKL